MMNFRNGVLAIGVLLGIVVCIFLYLGFSGFFADDGFLDEPLVGVVIGGSLTYFVTLFFDQRVQQRATVRNLTVIQQKMLLNLSRIEMLIQSYEKFDLPTVISQSKGGYVIATPLKVFRLGFVAFTEADIAFVQSVRDEPDDIAFIRFVTALDLIQENYRIFTDARFQALENAGLPSVEILANGHHQIGNAQYTDLLKDYQKLIHFIKIMIADVIKTKGEGHRLMREISACTQKRTGVEI